MGFTHVVEKLSFSMIPLILTFEFVLILGSFLSFGLVWGVRVGSTTVLGATHVVQQLSFSMFFSILTFDFDLIFGSFLTFWAPNGLFLGSGFGSKTVFGSPHVVEHFILYITFISDIWC